MAALWYWAQVVAALPSTKPHVSVWQNERFQADEMFSRLFDGTPSDMHARPRAAPC
jgi:hypothetical protein